MTTVQKLLYLIDEYEAGEYKAWDFSSQLLQVYHLENDGLMHSEAEKILSPLIECAKHFSSDESSRKMFVGRKSEEDVKKCAYEAYCELLALFHVNFLSEIWYGKDISDIKILHTFCLGNEDMIKSSQKCGCFYCLKIFPPSSITHWIVERQGVSARTARCPFCGIDSLLGDNCGREITEELLKEMHDYWF